jgi:hypothetical protein
MRAVRSSVGSSAASRFREPLHIDHMDLSDPVLRRSAFDLILDLSIYPSRNSWIALSENVRQFVFDIRY